MQQLRIFYLSLTMFIVVYLLFLGVWIFRADLLVMSLEILCVINMYGILRSNSYMDIILVRFRYNCLLLYFARKIYF